MLKKITRKITPHLRRIYIKLSIPSPPNMLGDRDIEHSWIAANIPEGNGKALDFGSGPTWMGLLAARKGFDMLAIDLTSINWYYMHPDLEFKQMDLLDLKNKENSFNLIINCSTIEHVGLRGRYNVKKEQLDGDLEAMEFLKKLLKSGKTMLLTIPVGMDTIYYPLHRIYGSQRLPRLLNGWNIIKEEYWIKDNNNLWIKAKKEEAVNIITKEHYYALGLFVLELP